MTTPDIAEVKKHLSRINPAVGATPLDDPMREKRAQAIHAQHPDLTVQEARQMVIIWEDVLLPFGRKLGEQAERFRRVLVEMGKSLNATKSGLDAITVPASTVYQYADGTPVEGTITFTPRPEEGQ